MLNKMYKILAVLSILSLLLAGAAAPASAAPWRDKVDPWVLSTASQGETEFLVFLVQPGRSQRGSSVCLPSWRRVHTYIKPSPRSLNAPNHPSSLS